MTNEAVTTAAIFTPFRDRGIDPYRPQNLEFVTTWWAEHSGFPIHVVDDGRSGTEPFNRSACYNKAVAEHPEVDVFVFAESDVFCDPAQIVEGVELAASAPGLVVPFARFLEISEADSIRVRAGELEHTDAEVKQIRGDYGSDGAINILSRDTYNLVGGYDPSFSSAWWDDSAMRIAFDVCCGPTRFTSGNVFHLFHASGGRKGAVATAEDLVATAENRKRYLRYKRARTPEQIRRLTRGG